MISVPRIPEQRPPQFRSIVEIPGRSTRYIFHFFGRALRLSRKKGRMPRFALAHRYDRIIPFFPPYGSLSRNNSLRVTLIFHFPPTRTTAQKHYICGHAEVVKLVDTHVSGTCALTSVGVRVPSSALTQGIKLLLFPFFMSFPFLPLNKSIHLSSFPTGIRHTPGILIPSILVFSPK